MVTPHSIKKAVNDFIEWDKLHPTASVKTTIKRLSRVMPEATEAKISLSTLPSVLAPMPESVVKNLERKLNKRKH